MKRYILLLVSLICIILLTACSTDEARAQKDDQVEYPYVVEDGKVSKKFYDGFDEYYQKANTIKSGYDILLEKEKEYPDLIFEEEYIDSVFTLTNQAILIEENFKLKGKNEIEKELSDAIKGVVTSEAVYATNLEEKVKEVKSDDEAMMFIIRSMTEGAIERLDNLVEKYELYE